MKSGQAFVIKFYAGSLGDEHMDTWGWVLAAVVQSSRNPPASIPVRRNCLKKVILVFIIPALHGFKFLAAKPDCLSLPPVFEDPSAARVSFPRI